MKKTAEKMHVPRPCTSVQLSELEETLGERLFRRSGRPNVLTDAGQVAFPCTDDTFTLDCELVNAVKQRPTAQALRLYVRVTDLFPKLVTNEIFNVVFTVAQAVDAITAERRVLHPIVVVLTKSAQRHLCYGTRRGKEMAEQRS